MVALALLRVPLARLVFVGIEMPGICTPRIGVRAVAAKRLEPRLELQNPLSLPSAKNIRHHLARVVSDRLPQPPRRGLLPHVGPHLLDCRFLSPLDPHIHLVRRPRVEPWLVYRGKQRTQQLERKPLTCRTRSKRLLSKPICFSQPIALHETGIGLFINRSELGRQM